MKVAIVQPGLANSACVSWIKFNFMFVKMVPNKMFYASREDSKHCPSFY